MLHWFYSGLYRAFCLIELHRFQSGLGRGLWESHPDRPGQQIPWHASKGSRREHVQICPCHFHTSQSTVLTEGRNLTLIVEKLLFTYLFQFILLTYIWFIMLCYFLLYSKVIQFYIYVYILYTCIYIFFLHIHFHYGSSQHIELSSLHCTTFHWHLKGFWIF